MVTDNLHLTEKEIQLLSAYLDGEVSEKERAAASVLLASHPMASRFLDDLRNLKSLLHTLPQRPLPRRYTLTRQEALAASPGWMVRGLRILSSVSAAALVVVLALDLLGPFAASTPEAMLKGAPMEEMAASEMMAAPSTADTAGPVVIFQMGARGMGGGGGEGGGEGGGGASPQGKPQTQPGVILPDISISMGEPLPQAGVMAEEAIEMETDAAQPKQDGDTGPILGVRPYDQRGQIITDGVVPGPLQHATQDQEIRFSTFRILEIAFFLLSIFSVLAALLIQRRKRAAR
jgi:hypothetical protein